MTSADRVLEALREIGPMTTREMAKRLGLAIQTVNSAIKLLSSSPRRVRVQSWVREACGARSYLRARHAIGNKPDAAKPPAKKVTGAQHRKSVKSRYANSSIFRMAEASRP